MRRTSSLASPRSAVVAAAVALALSACQSAGDPTDPDPTSTASATQTPTAAPDVESFESGPDSPLGYGLDVPEGATQLGPLTRIRSDRLINAYLPDLQAAQAQRDADQRSKAAEDAAEDPSATPTPVPTPTPDTRPSDDSFTLLEDEPRPDTILSVMRIDAKPTPVVRRMLAQIKAALPGTDVSTQLAPICQAKDKRITGCCLDVQGVTQDQREVRMVLTVDPGNVSTRTSAPSAQTRPVMTLQISYVGDPRRGQAERESNDIGDVEDVSDGADAAGLIWPSMDLDAPFNTPVADDFVAPANTTILLSGYTPSFAELTSPSAETADTLAEKWVADRAESDVAKDVVVDLNEVSTTYTGNKGKTFYRATYVLSARGNYVLLMVYPPDSPR